MKGIVCRVLSLFTKHIIEESKPITPSPESEYYIPSEEEKIWAKRKTAANLRRARELGIFVDLTRP